MAATADDLITAGVFIIALASFAGIVYPTFFVKEQMVENRFFRFMKVSSCTLQSILVIFAYD
jgi:hypothetical protein